MKGRSSSKQGKISKVCISMEKRKVDKVKEEPHLSGAYIRSLVKHLTSTRTKDSLNGDEKVLENLNTNGQCFSEPNNMQQASSPPPLPSPPIKKQVRRRQHTSKPYQERLLNMAEARKEIVTALKFHRASMKQQEAATNHDLESKQSLGNSGSKISLKAYPSTTTTTTTNLSNNYLDHHPSLSCPPSLLYDWPISTISPPPLPPPYHENLNIVLPNAPLGLNLNIQDFKNLETNLYHNPLSNYSTSSSLSLTSSCSSSSSCTSSSAVISELAASLSEEVVTPSTTTSSGGANTNGGGLHHAMDDEEMEEIRSLGEQHQMEWNDTVNLVTSARWLEFLKTIEIGYSHKFDYDEFSPFDQIMEFPPCMDIDEMEGMDGGWLA